MDIYFIRGKFEDGQTFSLSEIYSTQDEAQRAYERMKNKEGFEIVSTSVSVEDLIFTIVRDVVKSGSSPYFGGQVLKAKLGM